MQCHFAMRSLLPLCGLPLLCLWRLEALLVEGAEPFKVHSGFADARTLTVRSGAVVDQLGVYFADGKEFVAGGNGGKKEEFVVPAGEKLTKVSVWQAAFVNGIQFHTDKSSSKTFGNPAGKLIEYTANPGQTLVWVEGRAGDYVDSIKFGWESQQVFPPLKPFSIDCINSGIKRLVVRAGRGGLSQISFLCHDGSEKYTGDKIIDDLAKTFQVSSGQAITKASVWQGKSTYSLQFHTDQKSSKIFGNSHIPKEEWVHYEAEFGQELIGIAVEADDKIREVSFVWGYRRKPWFLKIPSGTMIMDLPEDAFGNLSDYDEVEITVKRKEVGKDGRVTSQTVSYAFRETGE